MNKYLSLFYIFPVSDFNIAVSSHVAQVGLGHCVAQAGLELTILFASAFRALLRTSIATTESFYSVSGIETCTSKSSCPKRQ